MAERGHLPSRGVPLVPTDALSLCTHSHTHMLRESIQGRASQTSSYTSMCFPVPADAQVGLRGVKVVSIEKHVRAAHLTGAPPALGVPTPCQLTPCHALGASLFPVHGPVSTECSPQEVCLLAVSVHLRLVPRPAGAGVVKKRRLTKRIRLCEWI